MNTNDSCTGAELVSGADAHITVTPHHEGVGDDRSVGERDEAAVADRNTMRVAGEVSQNLLRSTKGGLAVDHPRLGVERRQEISEGALVNMLKKSTLTSNPPDPRVLVLPLCEG